MIKAGDVFVSKYRVTPGLVSGFIELFGDRNVLHVDSQFAQARGFKDKVVHGNILGGFVSHWVGEGLPIKNVIIHQQSLKFSKPVYAGDEIELTGVVKEFHESVQVADIQLSFKNQTEQVVAKGTVQVGILPA